MNWLMKIVTWPKRCFYDYGSKLAIFLVRRRLKKRPKDAGSWILLARLHEVREDRRMAVVTLKQALQALPHNKAIEMHLGRLRARNSQGGG